MTKKKHLSPVTRRKGSPRWSIRIAIPLLITAVVVSILFTEDFHPDAFRNFHFSWRTIIGLSIAVLAFLIQNFTMASRYRLLSSKELSFRGGLRMQQMMEFTSAATPSSVGGSAVLFLFLSTEGIKAGKATAITFSALFLDELLLFLLSLVVIILYGNTNLFEGISGLASGLHIAFIIIALIVGAWAVILFVALFIKPHIPAHFLNWIARRRLFRRYASKIDNIGNELYLASKEITNRSFSYWLKLFILTMATWGSRFAIAVALIYGFASLEINFSTAEGNLWIAYAKQIAIWMLSLVMPTPGGSGFAEYMFKNLYGDFFVSGQIALMVAVIWRCLNAYIYFITGGLLLSFRGHRMGFYNSPKKKADNEIEPTQNERTDINDSKFD